MNKYTSQISALKITTHLEHHPRDAQQFRARIIEHAIITFLIQLRPQYPKLFDNIKATQILNRVLRKNNGNLPNQTEEQLDHIVSLLHEKYPELHYFHNHKSDGGNHHIGYPLIQYRSKQGKAIIQVFGAAIPIVEQWLGAADWQSWMSYKQVADKKVTTEEIAISDRPIYYRLMDWLPLNDESYRRWSEAKTLRERTTILDQAITGHVRRLAQSFIKAQDWPEIIADICMIRKAKKVKGYHHSDLSLNVIFRTNVVLPPSLAIGRAVSLGYGTQALTVWQEESSATIVPEIESDTIIV